MSKQTTEAKANTEAVQVQTEVAPAIPQTVSPYQAAGLVNGWLKEKGIDKTLPPQMFYTYVRKDMIKADADKKIAVSDLAAWFAGYIDRSSKRAAANEAKLEGDLAGENDKGVETVEAE